VLKKPLYSLILAFIWGCSSISDNPIPSEGYTVSGSSIFLDGKEVYYYGVNAMQTFGLGDPNLMNDWNIEITREFIGNFREQPFSGGAIQASDSVWYHPLQQIVDQNRDHGRITIICPFGWVDASGSQTLLTGLNPSDQSFYQAYKNRLDALASHFSDQPDVWIEVWNEPYHWNNENAYSHELWLSDMRELAEVVRSVSQSIIVIPGNEQGQSENALIEHGATILAEFDNVIFDLHAYEKWMINVSEIEVTDRLSALENLGLAVLFGEVGVINSTGLMNVESFIEAATNRNISLLGWLWVKNDTYQNSLLNEDGRANDLNNHNWGSTFKSVLQGKMPN
jgi:mannan endo-1,4-beta-mannosidase